MNLTDISTIKRLQKKYGFAFSKGLGQNFLLCHNALERVLEAVGAPDGNLLEIGPGFGTLTRELCQCAARVAAVEVDSAVLPVLKETLAEFDNYTVTLGDALKLDLAEFAAQQFANQPYSVAANLPYYITTPLIMHLLEGRTTADCIVLMVQKEVAQRLVSPPNRKEYGAITVMVNYYAQVQLVDYVAADCFYPQPKVDSAIIKLTPHKKPLYTECTTAQYSKVVRGAFAQRRKTLCNTLSSDTALGSKSRIAEKLEQIGVSPAARGETLDGKQFAQLAQALFED